MMQDSSGALAEGLHPDGTIFELRDLAPGVELRVGQEVRRRFAEGEGHEDLPVGHGGIGAGGELDGAAQEFYRRVGVPYEEKQIVKNGDVDLYKIFSEENQKS